MGIVERMLSASGITEQIFMDYYHRKNQIFYDTTRVKQRVCAAAHAADGGARA